MHTNTVYQLGFDRQHQLWTASGDGSAKWWRPYYGSDFLREAATAGGDFAGATAAMLSKDERWWLLPMPMAGCVSGRSPSRRNERCLPASTRTPFS